jgi:hypothetical protein
MTIMGDRTAILLKMITKIIKINLKMRANASNANMK